MSSFRRRAPTSPIPGSRPSPYNSLPLLSTGLASLDDILGGGLPLSSSLLLESDTPTAYAELLLKFWVSQGVECAQEVVIVASGLEGGPDEVIRTLPGVEGGAIVTGQNEKETVEEAEDDGGAKAEKMKIAFRYESMRQHAVTVAAPTRELFFWAILGERRCPIQGADGGFAVQLEQPRPMCTAPCSTLPRSGRSEQPTAFASTSSTSTI